MGLYSDIKKIASSSARAAKQGASLLAELAEEMDRGSDILLQATKAKKLEMEISEEGDNKLAVTALREKERELLHIYDILISKDTDSSRDGWSAKKRAVEIKRNKREVNARVEDINRLRRKIDDSNYKLPVKKQEDLTNLVSKIEGLLASQNTAFALTSELNDSKDQALTEIEALEKKRVTEIVEKFTSGVKKSHLRFKDGKKHGLSEYWYENGVKRLEVPFSMGAPASYEVRNWRSDGKLILEAKYRSTFKPASIELFSANGTTAFSLLYVEEQTSKVKVWLPNGICVGSFWLKGERVSFSLKGLVLLKVIFNLGFWVKLLMVILNEQKGTVSNLISGLEDALIELNSFLEEMQSVTMNQPK